MNNLRFIDFYYPNFQGDHGWHLGDHSEWCKLTLFETGNRVPFMIRIPGLTDEGMRSTKIVSECFRNAKFYNFKYPKCQKKNTTDINIDTKIRIIV